MSALFIKMKCPILKSFFIFDRSWEVPSPMQAFIQITKQLPDELRENLTFSLSKLYSHLDITCSAEAFQSLLGRTGPTQDSQGCRLTSLQRVEPYAAGPAAHQWKTHTHIYTDALKGRFDYQRRRRIIKSLRALVEDFNFPIVHRSSFSDCRPSENIFKSSSKKNSRMLRSIFSNSKPFLLSNENFRNFSPFNFF